MGFVRKLFSNMWIRLVLMSNEKKSKIVFRFFPLLRSSKTISSLQQSEEGREWNLLLIGRQLGCGNPALFVEPLSTS